MPASALLRRLVHRVVHHHHRVRALLVLLLLVLLLPPLPCLTTHHPSIDFKIKTMDVDGKRVKMQIWDTAGQERFRTITKAYYRGAMGVMLVYDVTKRDSYDSVSAWMSKICRHATDGTQKLLMGNKCDMEAERVVTLEEGEELATKFDVPFFETSAKEDINVNEAFVELARLIMRHYPQVGEPARTRKLSESVPASKPSSQSSCC